MSHTNKIFESQPVSIQNLNGFDLSHINTGTAICGKLTPVLRKLIMPASKFSLGVAANVELPPLATSFFGRIDAVIEVFFCPCAVLYGGWKQFISNQVATMFPIGDESFELDGSGYGIPLLSDTKVAAIANRLNTLNVNNRGLADYLGIRVTGAITSSEYDNYWNLLPFIAYHKIWDTFYRNASVTKTIFAVNPLPSPNSEVSFGKSYSISYVWHSYLIDALVNQGAYSGELPTNVFNDLASLTFPDGVDVFTMRQRNWSRGYFTAASLDPQMGY